MWGGPGGLPQNPWLTPAVTLSAGVGIPQHTQQQQQQQQQWSLNPTHYANIPHNQVDWAALAQQWMMLKGAVGPPPIPHTISNSIGGGEQGWNRAAGGGFGGSGNASFEQQQQLHQHNNRGPFHHLGRVGGGGNGEGLRINPVGDIIEEAPMELESLDQEPQPQPNSIKNDPWNAAGTMGASNAWLSPEENNPWKTLTGSPVSVSGNQRVNTSSLFPAAGNSPSPTAAPALRPMLKQKKQRGGRGGGGGRGRSVEYGYFTSSPSGTKELGAAAGGTRHWSTSEDGLSSLYQQDSGSNSQDFGFTGLPGVGQVAGNSSDENSGPDFDAAKRKTLPAWIREGLEKMEKEKKKKEIEARLAQEREEQKKRQMEEEAKALAAAPPPVVSQEMKWARPESLPASEDEGEEEREKPSRDKERELLWKSTWKKMTNDEQEEAIMHAIRRVSTSLLVTVTDELITDAATASFNRALSQKKGLGLGGYGSGSEESEASDAEEEEEKQDSEEELLMEVNRKKRNWESIREDIERKLDGRSPPRSRHASASKDVPINGDRAGSSSDAKKSETSDIRRSSTEDEGNSRSRKRRKSRSIRKESRSRSKSLESSDKQKSKSRSRSRSAERKKKRSKSRTRSRSLSRDRKKKRSKSRTRSRSLSKDRRKRRSKSRSRSKDRKKRKSKSRSTSRSRDRKKKKSRSRSRSRSKDKRRKKSRSRSRSASRRHKKSKARSRSKERRKRRSKTRSRSGSRSRTHRRKSKSRSISRDRKKRKSKSRSRSRDRRRSKSRSSSRSTDRRKRKSKSRSRSRSKDRSKRRHK